MDVCARGLLAAERMIADGQLAAALRERYAGWRDTFGQDVLAGRIGLQALSDRTLERNAYPDPVSGRQEYFENLVNRYC